MYICALNIHNALYCLVYSILSVQKELMNGGVVSATSFVPATANANV